MDLQVRWHAPFLLRPATAQEPLLYACDTFDSIPDVPGVYLFARRHGEHLEPIYIGRATRIQKRIEQHLKSVPLMKAVQQASSGERLVLAGEWLPKRGQQERRALPLIESALIKFALAEGYSIVNDKGTKTPVHTISMSGNRAAATKVFRSAMKVSAR